MTRCTTVDWADGICTVTFDRDAKRNAFSEQMSREVAAEICEAESRGLAVVLTAKRGADVWSAGHDLNEIESVSDLADDTMFDLLGKIADCRIPVICSVDGDVYAGGFLILLMADIVLATTRSKFSMPINKMGIPLPRHFYKFALGALGIHKAKELFLCASPISSYDACNSGLVNHVVGDHDELVAKGCP